MIRLLAGVAVAALATASPVPPEPAAPPASRLPGFAASLADRPLPFGPGAWRQLPEATSWRALAASSAADRQAIRWDFAASLLARGRAPDALGVLEVMLADDPDLALVPAWQRARGAALVSIGRDEDGLAALASPALVRDAESCLWRLAALAAQDKPARALSQLGCAKPALDARHGAARRPFVLAVGRAGIATGQHAPALAWLQALPDGDPAANVLRGQAYAALGQVQQARLRLARTALTGTPEEQADAALSTIEMGLATRSLPRTEAVRRLDRLTYGWRGDAVERRALLLSMKLADQAHDTGRFLVAGAALFRYFDLGADAAPLASRLQAALSTALAADAATPLDRAAGLFWDYRDLAPAGAEGVRLSENLAARLQAAGLYARAADLLQYRLAGVEGVEKGPLSVRIATLRILGGDPTAAIRILRETDDYPYPLDMAADRRRIEAAALTLSGKATDALAALQDVPDADAVRAEIYWRAHDWAHLAQIGEPTLPPAGHMSDVAQAIVLRHAIALAMLGREDALARLRARYEGSFASLPTAATFALLTGTAGNTDPAALAKAMAALPTASPAPDFADLIGQGAEAMKPAG